MCVTYEVDGEVVQSQGELAARMPAGVVFADDDPESRGGDCCLCGVDAAATAEANGYAVREKGPGDDWWPEVVLVRAG